MHILVVDDDEFLLRKLDMELKDMGHDVRTAGSVAQARLLVQGRARTFDLVLTDVRMPDECGLSLVEHLHEAGHSGAIAIMSAYADMDMTIAALRLHAVDFLIKPVTDAALHDLIERAHNLRGSGLRKQMLELPVMDDRQTLILPTGRDWIGDLARRLTEHFSVLLLEADRDNFCLAISEALQNAVIHGNLELSSKLKEDGDWQAYEQAIQKRSGESPWRDRKVVVECHYDGRSIQLAVEDEGPGFDSSALSSPLEPDALLDAGGRGITLIWFAMDEVSWNARGNRIEMTKHVAR